MSTRFLVSDELECPILLDGLNEQQIKLLAEVMLLKAYKVVNELPQGSKVSGTNWLHLFTFPRIEGMTVIGVCVRKHPDSNDPFFVVHDVMSCKEKDKVLLYFGKGYYTPSLWGATREYWRRLVRQSKFYSLEEDEN